MIKELALIGRLIDYPTQEIQDGRDELIEFIRNTPYLPAEKSALIAAHMERELSKDIYEQQMRYDGLFERGRSLSL